MAKAWLQERWDVLLPLLAELSVEQEKEIARICSEEIAEWKARPSMKSLSSLKEPMSDTRNKIRELPLTDANSYVNVRTGKREHIALKYLNYSEADWASMNKQSDARFHERLENQQLLDHPDQIVAKATELLSSKHWPDVVVGLAVVTGRRLAEILKVGELYPKTLYSVVFSGQLKRKDEVLKPYEIPVLCEASIALAAWSRLRTMVDCSKMETEAIGKAYNDEVGEAAARHFSDLVPVRDGREKLFAHLFRAVYPRLAVFSFCPASVSDIVYVSTVLGHYWSNAGDETQQRNYVSSLHYFDYKVGDGAGNIDGRQGIRLGDPGVEVLEVFKPKAATKQKGASKVSENVSPLALARKSQTGFSMYRPKQETKERLDLIRSELQARTEDDVLKALVDEHYVLRQLVTLLAPLYEQLGVDNPIGAVQALLGDGGAVQVDQKLNEHFKTSLTEVVGLLDDASQESETPAAYLRELLAAKRTFKKSYENRHAGKDYSTMTTAELRHTKTPGAAQERFRRAVDAIIAYNDQAEMPELLWYINPAVVVDLVGGRPPDVKEYLETRREEIDAHHTKHSLTPGYNRRPIPITVRVSVPDLPTEVQTAEASESEEKA